MDALPHIVAPISHLEMKGGFVHLDVGGTEFRWIGGNRVLVNAWSPDYPEPPRLLVSDFTWLSMVQSHVHEALRIVAKYGAKA